MPCRRECMCTRKLLHPLSGVEHACVPLRATNHRLRTTPRLLRTFIQDSLLHIPFIPEKENELLAPDISELFIE